MAREEVCRCSCGGKNHGCLRSKDGVQPARMSKIDGVMYTLREIGTMHETLKIAQRYNRQENVRSAYAATSRNRAGRAIPAKIRRASTSQIERWPELASYRGIDLYYFTEPCLLWVRSDFVAQDKGAATATQAGVWN